MSVVFLFGLPKKSEIVMKMMLHEYFSSFGKIVNISVPNTESGKCKRHAFVFFDKKTAAANVLKTSEHHVKIYTIKVDKAVNAPDLEFLPPLPVMKPVSVAAPLAAPTEIEEVPEAVKAIKNVKAVKAVKESDTNPFPPMEITYSREIEEWAIKEGCTLAMIDLIDETLDAIKGKDEYSTMLRVEEAMEKIFGVIRFAEDNLDYSRYHREVFEECCSRILKDEDTASCLESVKSALIV